MERIISLRQWLVGRGLAAFIVPSSDSHQSEYVAEHWACRKWISNFTGSAGTVVVTAHKAALWTDSRYFLQAQMQLNTAAFDLQKMGMPDTPSIEQWILLNTAKGDKIGVDARLFTKNQFDDLKTSLADRELVVAGDPFAEIWQDRPAMPTAKAMLLGEEYSGESAASKIARIRPETGTLLVGILDDIAWLLNIRGSDIECNPLVISYAAVEQDRVLLFVDQSKFSDEDKAKLSADGVQLRAYDSWDEYLKGLQGQVVVNPARLDMNSWSQLTRVVANPARLDMNSWSQLTRVDVESTPQGAIASAKAVKNATEVAGFRRAMVEDGVALCRFMMWLEQQEGGLTEYGAGVKLSEFRAKSQDYRGDSFGAIVGYGDNGAIVHYSAPTEGSAVIARDNFLLIDSGGQYICGTTDITRTIHMGVPTEAQKHDYTNILMGVIDISRAIFPCGTRGVQLDVLARQHMWRSGANYMHGTGHGVGHYLCVHEGPQSIRMNENPVTLKVGMVQSVEPAIYRTDEYGIRTENLIVVQPAPMDGYMQFETLTLSPIDTKAIDASMMCDHHVEWLNHYHAMVYDRLSPHLNEDERVWLKVKTAAI